MAVAILTLLAGLGCLLPGGFCSVAGLMMQFDRDQMSGEIGVLFLVIGLPLALIGFFLVRFAWRRLRGPKLPAVR